MCQQEVQLAQQAKLAQDLKAALLLVCGVLKQTSFVQPDVSGASALRRAAESAPRLLRPVRRWHACSLCAPSLTLPFEEHAQH